MLAVDTNVLVRLLARDNREQAAAAAALFKRDSIWIAKTVLLETEWVLRNGYDFEDAAIAQAFKSALSLENVTAEGSHAVANALALTSHGLDFADALHLSSRPAGATFVSFDRKLVRRAASAGITGVVEP